MIEHRCDGKRTYRAERAAQLAAKQMRRKVIDCFRLQHYWCDRHQGWHVGNKPIHGLVRLAS